MRVVFSIQRRPRSPISCTRVDREINDGHVGNCAKEGAFGLVFFSHDISLVQVSTAELQSFPAINTDSCRLFPILFIPSQAALLDQVSIDRGDGLARLLEGQNILHAQSLKADVGV